MVQVLAAYTNPESHNAERHRQTDRQTDGQQDYANSRSYCVAVRSAKKQVYTDITVRTRTFRPIYQAYWSQITGFCNKQILYETVQNHQHGNYSTIPDIFMFQIAECSVEKRTEKSRKKYNEYHYTRYDMQISYVNQLIFCLFVVSFHSCIFFYCGSMPYGE